MTKRSHKRPGGARTETERVEARASIASWMERMDWGRSADTDPERIVKRI